MTGPVRYAAFELRSTQAILRVRRDGNRQATAMQLNKSRIHDYPFARRAALMPVTRDGARLIRNKCN